MPVDIPPRNVCPKCLARGTGERIEVDVPLRASSPMVCTACGARYRWCDQVRYEDRAEPKRRRHEASNAWRAEHRGHRALYEARWRASNRESLRRYYRNYRRTVREDRRKRVYENNKELIDSAVSRSRETAAAMEGDEMAVHNTLGDLSNLMFEQLERLNEAEPEELEQEIGRAKAMSSVGQTIIENSNTILRAMQFKDNALSTSAKLPRMLGTGED